MSAETFARGAYAVAAIAFVLAVVVFMLQSHLRYRAARRRHEEQYRRVLASIRSTLENLER